MTKPGRQGEFASGATSGPTEPASLQQRAARFNSLNPGKFVPTGLNQPIMPSGNAMSAKDAQRITPAGMLPNVSNGASADTASRLVPSYGMTLNI